jgi:hypothetical protein
MKLLTIVGVPRWCIWVTLVLLAGFGFLHLSADFPNHSRWIDDSARFTDEGWWAAGAINHILTGHWLRPGGYNPMVTVPLWSLLMDAIFHFVGINVAVARGVAFSFTIGTVLVGGALMAHNHRPLAPGLMMLIGGSPLLYFFSRSAILEAPLIFFLTAAALAAYATPPPGMVRSIVCGVLFTLAMLTKSSALFVAPAILYLLWFPHRRLWSSEVAADRARAMLAVAIPALTFTVCFGLYWLLFIHTHPVDVHIFLDNNKPVLDLRSVEKSVRLVYRCFTWLDPVLFPVAVVAVFLSIRRFPVLWQDPLFGFAVLFFLGYSGFMVWHFDASPRYFAVLVVPVMILVMLLLNALELRMGAAYKALGAVVLLAVVVNVAYIARLLAHPDYTLRDACLKIRSQIDSDPSVNRLVIGHGVVETTLFTHIPALDDLGSVPTVQKIDLYHPGWAVVWSDDVGVLAVPSVARSYAFTETGKYAVFDQPGRGFLLLYRIQAKRPATP